MSKEALIAAIKNGDVPKVREILDQEPGLLSQELHWDSFSGGRSGYAVHCAASLNQPDVIAFLVEEKKESMNRNDFGAQWTPLIYARDQQSYAAAARLLDLGADPSIAAMNRDNTIDFCASDEVRFIVDPQYKENRRQEKIAGTWVRTTSKEIVHEYELPDNGLHIRDIFNFESGFWKSVTQDVTSGSIAQSIFFFQDMPDETMIEKACDELNKRAEAAGEEKIDRDVLRGVHVNPAELKVPRS